MIAGRVPVLGMSTFFVGRERCRLPEGLALAGLMRRLGRVQASVSMRAVRGFVITAQDGGAGPFSEDDVVEVEDYDPVRHSCLAIGKKEPSGDTPVHWMAYRTDELTRAVAFVWATGKRTGVGYTAQRHPAGSFQEALEIVALAKRTGAPAGAEGRGFIVRGGSADELVASLAETAQAADKGDGK